MLQDTPEVKKEYSKFYKDFNAEDRWTTWFYKPHTLTALIIIGIFVVYFAFTRTETSSEANIKFGLLAVSLVYLLISAVQMPDGLFVRPHPVIWRILMGASVIYLCLMIFLLFQTVDDVRFLLSKLDPDLGKPLPERSYAEDCRLYTPENPDSNFANLMGTLKDEFMVAHLLGWFGKGILLRDYYLCWILSVLFEIIEISLQHLLPNFAECWWDHIILDIFVCNLIGFTLGLKVTKIFSMKPYNWVAKISDVQQYNWAVLTSWKRLAAVLLLGFTVTMIELNAFFLKFVLWIPPPHPVNVVRLFLWWGIGLPGVREFYQWVTDPNCKRFGTMSWMCAAVVGVEILVWLKFSQGVFHTSAPPAVVWGWGLSVAALFIWAVWYYGFYSRKNTTRSPANNNHNNSNKKRSKKVS